MTDKRFEELLAHFGGTQAINTDDGIRLVHPSHTCSQRMRVSKWKKYELFGCRAPSRPPVTDAQTTRKPVDIVTKNGMRFRLGVASK